MVLVPSLMLTYPPARHPIMLPMKNKLAIQDPETIFTIPELTRPRCTLVEVNTDGILLCGAVHHLGDGHAGEGHPSPHHAGREGDRQSAEELRETRVLTSAGRTWGHFQVSL